MNEENIYLKLYDGSYQKALKSDLKEQIEQILMTFVFLQEVVNKNVEHLSDFMGKYYNQILVKNVSSLENNQKNISSTQNIENSPQTPKRCSSTIIKERSSAILNKLKDSQTLFLNEMPTSFSPNHQSKSSQLKKEQTKINERYVSPDSLSEDNLSMESSELIVKKNINLNSFFFKPNLGVQESHILKHESSPNYRELHREISRNKDKRKAMNGYNCHVCENFYDAVCDGKILNKDKFVQECSRHRSNLPFPETPKVT